MSFVYPLGVGLGIAFVSNPASSIEEGLENLGYVGLGYSLRTETGKKVVTGAIKLGVRSTSRIGAIVIADLISVGRALALTRTGVAVSGLTSTAVGIGAGAIIGYAAGAAIGTGAGYLIDGSRGANAARDLYTGKVSKAQYTTTLAMALNRVMIK